MKLLHLLLAGLLAFSPLPAAALDSGTPSIATAQVTVAATATLTAPARPTRGKVTITNLGTTDVFCGTSAVTTTTGNLLVGTKGASITIDTRAEVYCIVAAATQGVGVMEVF